ncbi:MAG: glycosyltransferase [Halobacteriaceae archaeon]
MAYSLGIVVPAYKPDVTELTSYISTLSDTVDPDVIRIELDAPSASTIAALADLPVTVNAVDKRRGKGAAITAGFEALTTDILAFVDADGSTPSTSVEDVIEPIKADNADLSIGSRRHPDATIESHQTFARRRLGDAFAWLARSFLDVNIYDFQCGAKAITAEGWQTIRSYLYTPGFAWDVELIALCNAFDFRIVEVPIVWHDKPGSTVSPLRTAFNLFTVLISATHRSKKIQGSFIHNLISKYQTNKLALVEQLSLQNTDE